MVCIRGTSACLIMYEHAMLPQIEYYYAGNMIAPDYKSGIWIPVKNRPISKNQWPNPPVFSTKTGGFKTIYLCLSGDFYTQRQRSTTR